MADNQYNESRWASNACPGQPIYLPVRATAEWQWFHRGLESVKHESKMGKELNHLSSDLDGFVVDPPNFALHLEHGTTISIQRT